MPEEALTAATAAAEHLDAIRKIIRDAAWAHARGLRVPLTAPQLSALQILVEEHGASEGGVSISELSRRMGLAHSTVSGIVDRLERRRLVSRTPQPQDRRFVLIELTPAVKHWLQDELPAARLGPLAQAMEKASERQRLSILASLAELRQLLDE
jgi:DNA-binding MarR family transcriptional regulator